MDNKEINNKNLADEFYRYFSFWYIYLISGLIFVLLSLIYLRYTNPVYYTSAKIEILDDAMDSEMALPTAVTIFNRSTINLENEREVLTSYRLISKVVENQRSNVTYYTKGRFRDTENHSSQWFNNIEYDLKFNIDLLNNSEQLAYEIYIDESGLRIVDIINDEVNSFESFNTENDKTISLPFNLSIKTDDAKKIFGETYSIKINRTDYVIQNYIDRVEISPIGKNSDLVQISLNHQNPLIARSFINNLIDEFNEDGINDRQQVFKSTIDFVNLRFSSLSDDLGMIESQKQKFKQNQGITFIEANAEVSMSQRLLYESELFNVKTQLELVDLLNSSMQINTYELAPINIGIENININKLIDEYNLLIIKLKKLSNSAGENNYRYISVKDQIDITHKNILNSIKNYNNSLNFKIDNLENKKEQYNNIYSNLPKNEKLLRSIEREQEIKEALFLLLLQKREEASINFAVTKPSIKVIDYAISDINPIFPVRSFIILFAFILGFSIPLIILFIRFNFDTKIHTREDLLNNLKNDFSIVGEVPHITDKDELKSIVSNKSRNILSESIRMIIANLNFVLFNDGTSKSRNNLILVTSSVKGEGKTVVSTNMASILSTKYKKVLLVGADLRNPQIHKFLGISKTNKGLSDYIYDSSLSWKDLLYTEENFDILLSGTIPPNPTDLISSKRFSDFISEVRNQYDYIIIDSAPCILVSDTFEISKFVDTTVYVVRSNYSQVKLCEFIDECKNDKKLSNISLVLNGVGNSKSYGYKYGYQYGYKYGYKYGYNYGYGYGYSETNE